MLGFARNIVFFRVNGGSVAEKSWFARATVLGVAALESIPVRLARAVELMVPGDFFSSLMMLCYCVLHVLKHFVHWNCCIEEMRSLLDLLEFEGRLARKLRFHPSTLGIQETSHESLFSTSSTLGIPRKPRTKASFSHLQLLEVQGSLARKLRFYHALQNGSFSALASRSGFRAAKLLQFVEPLCVILLRFATQCLQIAVEWLRQCSSQLQLQA